MPKPGFSRLKEEFILLVGGLFGAPLSLHALYKSWSHFPEAICYGAKYSVVCQKQWGTYEVLISLGQSFGTLLLLGVSLLFVVLSVNRLYKHFYSHETLSPEELERWNSRK